VFSETTLIVFRVYITCFLYSMAIDLEPEMIAAGQNEATQRGVNTITWMVRKAEEVQVPPVSCELITIGEAFHCLNQQLVAKQALQWYRS
jgi:ubiquinone/menaquinone biosynthesis C-methylase UbiE